MINKKKINFDLSETKSEFYTKVKIYKLFHIHYVIDKIFSEPSIPVLKLPSNYRELNLIEKIWATVKNYVTGCNVTFKINDVRS